MTNAELYIGDEDLIDQFIDEFNKFACKQDWDLEHHYLKERLAEFFKQDRTPTLTEDERVILRNIRNDEFCKCIGRGDSLRENTPTNYNLYLRGNDESKAYAIGTIYNHLFQFIKERRRI